MCQNKITIFNNSNYVNLKSFDVVRQVSCGKCVECQRSKQIEYAIRGYFEYLECIKNGGFAYFDTLSYNDNHLPKFFGFPCFDKLDVQRYFSRLRRKLDTKFGISEDALRYFVTCEYGDKYHRPHYHVIYFVHSNNIDPYQFHSLLVNCWRRCKKRVIKVRKNGTYCHHRDGSPIYQYVPDIRGNTDLKHAVNPLAGVLHSNAAITYVTKYIVKEDIYVMTLAANINEELVNRGYPGLSFEDYKNYFQPWHLQSLGFGSYLEKCLDQRKYIRKLTCVIPTGDDGVTGEFGLPMYYIRRLFYSRITLPDGRVSWIKKLGYRQKLYKMEMEHFDEFVKHTESQINSIDHLYYLLDHEANLQDFSRLKIKVLNFKDSYKTRSNTLGDSVKSCLGDYTVRDYCTYVKYFSGWFQPTRFKLDVDEIVSTRIYDDGEVLNPLRGSYAEKCKFLKSVVNRNYYKYGRLDDLKHLLFEMSACFSQYSLFVETEKRKKNRELKALTLIT